MALLLRSMSLIVMVAVLGAMVACSSNKADVSSQVQQAIAANKNAKTLQEYESSESNPEVLFSNWTIEEGSEICTHLLELAPYNLTVFEEQIGEKENREILKSCLPQLKKRLKSHYDQERKKLSVQLDPETLKVPAEKTSRFRFKDDIQYRDTSKGYTAWHGDLKRKEVVLTFDDGPHAEYTPSILNTLKQANVKAIFFEMGKNIRQHPELTKAVAAGGHSIGSHSMTHGCLGQSQMCANHNRLHRLNGGQALTEEQAMAEIKGAHQMIYDILGWVDPFFRFPYGESSPNLRAILNKAGVANFLWSIDSNDWKNQTPQELVRSVISDLEKNQSGIILFHDIQRRTAEALPELLSELYARGYTPVVLQPRDSKARLADGLIKSRQGPIDIPTKP